MKKNYWRRFLLLAAIAIAMCCGGFIVLAAPPDSPYAPNETIAPTCAPGTANCIVRLPAMSGANTDITQLSGLTTPLGPALGGTGITSFSSGDLLYATGIHALNTIPIGADGQVLKISGGIPAWGTDLTSLDDDDASSTFTAGTGIDSSSLSSNIIAVNPAGFNLNSVGGTLSITKGGTGLSGISSGDLWYGSGVNTLSALPIGAEGQVLKVTSGVPSWATQGGGSSFTAGTGISAVSLASNTIAVDQSVLDLQSLGGTLSLAKGGTGGTDRASALLNLVPSVTGNAGRFLTTDGGAISWGTPSSGSSEVSWGSVTGTLSNQSDVSAALAAKEPVIASGTISQYWRGDKSWQALNAAAVGLGNVENTALSTWNGSTNVTTVGTIVSGTWNGAPIDAAHGGTGVTSTAAALTSLLPSQASNAGKVLTTNGATVTWAAASTSVAWGSLAGTLSNQLDLAAAFSGKEYSIATGTTAQYWRGDKTWQTLNATAVGLGSVENTALSSWSGSTNLTTLGTVTGGVWNSTAIPTAYGGTNGAAIPTAGALAYGTGSAYAFTSAGSSGQVLRSAGISSPTWSTATFPSTADSAGNYLRSDGTNFVSTPVTQNQVAPSDPSTTNSTTGVMMGLAGSITPARSGKVLVIISGDVDNNTAGDGAQIRIRYGTGAAPSNGNALTGTIAGTLQKVANPSIALLSPGRFQFSISVIVTGLTVNSAYWMDLELAAISGGTARVRDVNIAVVEL